MEYFKCDYCLFTCRSKSGYYKHKKKMHPEELNTEHKTLVCSENECSGRGFRSLNDYLKHFKTVHPDLKINQEKHSFQSKKEFLVWKCSIESSSLSQFVQPCGTKKLKSGLKITYYYCNRNGIFKPRGAGLRELKATKSRKTTKSCPASMVVSEDQDVCHVKFCSTHLGHSLDVEHLDLNIKEKLEIVEILKDTNLNKQLAISKIKSIPGQNPKRNRICRKDIENIIRQFKLCDYKRLDDDKDDNNVDNDNVVEFGSFQNLVDSFDLNQFVDDDVLDVPESPDNDENTSNDYNPFYNEHDYFASMPDQCCDSILSLLVDNNQIDKVDDSGAEDSSCAVVADDTENLPDLQQSLIDLNNTINFIVVNAGNYSDSQLSAIHFAAQQLQNIPKRQPEPKRQKIYKKLKK